MVMTKEWKRRDLLALVAFFLFFFLYLNTVSLHSGSKVALEQQAFSKDRQDDGRPHRTPRPGGKALSDVYDKKSPANETLGFGAIVAVSKQGSKRRKSLLDGAALTDLSITIPDQPRWTDADVNAMKDPKYSIISKGSALAWLGHLNALQWFLESNLSTALIIEDDVDWDLHIRQHQVPLVASEMRKLLAKNPAEPDDHFAAIREHNREQSYWGDMTQWEVLYLGHCGDYFDLKYWQDLPHNIFHDPSLPRMEFLHPETQTWLREAGIGSKQRMVHRSKQPLCSFAYAVNRKSAERMLAELAKEEEGHGTWSFDVRLLEACRDLGWKCWTANPELFHHQDEHDSAISEVNGQPLFEQDPSEVWDGTTPNIGCGARSPRFLAMQDASQIEQIKLMAQHVDVCSLDELMRKDEGMMEHESRRDPL